MNIDATVTPAKLVNRKHGLYSWSNGGDVLTTGYLSANIYRSNPDSQWEIRYFVSGVQGDAAHIQTGVWTLRQARLILALMKERYVPGERTEAWQIRYYVGTLAKQAWFDAADIEDKIVATKREAKWAKEREAQAVRDAEWDAKVAVWKIEREAYEAARTL